MWMKTVVVMARSHVASLVLTALALLSHRNWNQGCQLCDLSEHRPCGVVGQT